MGNKEQHISTFNSVFEILGLKCKCSRCAMTFSAKGNVQEL